MTGIYKRPTPSASRLAILTFGIVLALSLVFAGEAFGEPEFKPVGGAFAGADGGEGASELKAATSTITCAVATANGEISSATLAGDVTVEFAGCTSTGSGGSNCTIKSTNTTTAGAILTNTLHGVLGLILPKGTGSGVGVLVLPESGKSLATLTSNKCTVATTVFGDVAGELGPIGVSQTTGKVTFAAGSTGESIKTFDLSTGGKVTPEIEAFGVEASVAGGGLLASSAALEIT